MRLLPVRFVWEDGIGPAVSECNELGIINQLVNCFEVAASLYHLSVRQTNTQAPANDNLEEVILPKMPSVRKHPVRDLDGNAAKELFGLGFGFQWMNRGIQIV